MSTLPPPAAWFRPNVAATAGYIPGEQPPPGTPVIKLNTNENPYPPSPEAVEVLRSLDPDWLRRYPNAYAQPFREAVSEVLGVPPDWVIVGNGSDELLSVVIRACANEQRAIAYPTPTYVLYRTLAAMQPAPVVEIPYPDTWELPIAALVAARPAVTFVASPNSPSGHSVAIAELRALATQLDGVLVIDEAYVDFATESAVDLVQEYPNVIILRTLSKGYGLAGLRLGFGVAHPALLEGLFKVKDSYNVDAIATLVGAAAMRDQAYMQAQIANVKASRAQLTSALTQIGFRVWPSQANFVLTQPQWGEAGQICQALKERGILVRYFNQPGLADKLRITVGTDVQNQALIQQLQELRPA